MSDLTTRNDKRKLWVLGGLGLGLAMLGRRRRWRQYAMSQAYGRGFGGRYGPWAHGGPQQAGALPPFIEETLKAWHDRAHGTLPPSGAAPEHPGTTEV